MPSAASLPGSPRRTLDIDAAAGVLDDEDRETFAPGILGRVAHAKIECEAG